MFLGATASAVTNRHDAKAQHPLTGQPAANFRLLANQ